jgi:hypothetical protein
MRNKSAHTMRETGITKEPRTVKRVKPSLCKIGRVADVMKYRCCHQHIKFGDGEQLRRLTRPSRNPRNMAPPPRDSI